MTSCCTLCHRLCLKKGIRSQDKFDFTSVFIRIKLGGASTPQYRLNFAPCDFFLSKLKERLAGRKFTRVQDLSKNVRHFRAQRYTCFAVPICSSYVCFQKFVWPMERDAIWRLVQVWWKYVHWFQFYITCDWAFGLALVLFCLQILPYNIPVHTSIQHFAN